MHESFPREELHPSSTVSQTLLFDADDTLWENNVYFERAIEGFIELLNHPTWSAVRVREEFNRVEHARVAVHGYGAKSFRASLLFAFNEFRGRPCSERQQSSIDDLTAAILDATIDLLPGVATTLTALAQRHTLLLVTKGDRDEQVAKLNRSGLAPLFAHVEVLPEKNREAYLELRSRYRHEAAHTWMIGNSPRSDINPALAAGLNAVYLPHPNTWVLEHDQIHPAPQGQRLVELGSFADLLTIFA